MKQLSIKLPLMLIFALVISCGTLLTRPLSQAHAAGPTVGVWLTTSDQTNLLTPQANLTFGDDSGSIDLVIRN